MASYEGKLKWCTEIIVISIIVVLLWTLLALPIVFYNIENIAFNESNFSICSSPHLYSDGVCYSLLRDTLTSQGCEIGATDSILVAENSEAIAKTAINNLNQLNLSLECSQNVTSFLCSYLFGLCGGEEFIQPTMKNQCEDIQFNTCLKEWTSIAMSGFYLPDCSELPDGQNISCQNVSRKSSSLACQEDFFFEEDLRVCVPKCPNWSEHSSVTSAAIRITILTSFSIGLLLAVIVLVVSIVRRTSMFKFPSIFLVYTTMDLLVLDFFMIVGNSDASLFCSSPNLLVQEVTSFCAINGIVFQYTLIQLGLWWMFHLSVLFWGVWFPFHYNKYKRNKKFKYIHASFVLIGTLVPTFSVIATMADYVISIRGSENITFVSGGLGYVPFTSPGVFCVSISIDVAFYAMILPIDLTLGVVGLLAILIVYGFYKSNKLVGASEKKLALVLCYFILVTVITIATFTTILGNAEALHAAIQEYFECEAQGYNPNNPCRRSFEEYQFPALLLLLLIVLALYPLYLLIFVINFYELKRLCTRKVNKTNVITLSSMTENQ